MSVESFIQTDAVVNPGNSGGALVNLKGQLIGINTAIASPTGSYSGYSFAVPSNLVEKVVNDLKEFGTIQRALLGVNIADVNDPSLEDKTEELTGIYIVGVGEQSAADKAGMEVGDVIKAINGKQVRTVPELQEQVALNRPGDKIRVTFLRNGRSKTVSATLQNTSNNTDIVSSKRKQLEIDGTVYEEIDDLTRGQFGLRGGVVIKEFSGGPMEEAGVPEGFIITRIDSDFVDSVDDLARILDRKDDGFTVLGRNPDGSKDYYMIRR